MRRKAGGKVFIRRRTYKCSHKEVDLTIGIYAKIEEANRCLRSTIPVARKVDLNLRVICLRLSITMASQATLK